MNAPDLSVRTLLRTPHGGSRSPVSLATMLEEFALDWAASWATNSQCTDADQIEADLALARQALALPDVRDHNQIGVVYLTPEQADAIDRICDLTNEDLDVNSESYCDRAPDPDTDASLAFAVNLTEQNVPPLILVRWTVQA